MKLVFSRKGFDSASGGMASPILPDGSLCWLPIPANEGNIRYAEIFSGPNNLGEVITQLSAGSLSPDACAHLDPDVNYNSIQRLPGWRPIFGQSGAAQGHLENENVQRGDIFVFYGWFRQTEFENNRLKFLKSDPGRHLIFGWMQIGDWVPVRERGKFPEWALYHPHLNRTPRYDNDTLYFASKDLALPNACYPGKGCGYFTGLSNRFVLSSPGASRSVWQLPMWFFPGERKKPLSYHTQRSRWNICGDHLILKTAARGQEFVLDCCDYPESVDWIKELVISEAPSMTSAP